MEAKQSQNKNRQIRYPIRLDTERPKLNQKKQLFKSKVDWENWEVQTYRFYMTHFCIYYAKKDKKDCRLAAKEMVRRAFFDKLRSFELNERLKKGAANKIKLAEKRTGMTWADLLKGKKKGDNIATEIKKSEVSDKELNTLIQQQQDLIDKLSTENQQMKAQLQLEGKLRAPKPELKSQEEEKDVQQLKKELDEYKRLSLDLKQKLEKVTETVDKIKEIKVVSNRATFTSDGMDLKYLRLPDLVYKEFVNLNLDPVWVYLPTSKEREEIRKCNTSLLKDMFQTQKLRSMTYENVKYYFGTFEG